jgi:hypothetical protein
MRIHDLNELSPPDLMTGECVGARKGAVALSDPK